MIESNLYSQRGVSSSKTEVHNAISNIDPGLFPGAFCKVLPDYLSNDPQACLIMHADGAGTKSSLAYLYWKETGDLSVFRDIAIDALVMNLDDLICIGALENLILSNTIGRNKFHIPQEVISAIIEGYSEYIALLEKWGVKIHLAGGETADVGDLTRTIIVDSTMMARIKQHQIINANNIQNNDVIIGFASFGQAVWEEKYNSGIGSNGLTAARHDLFQHLYAEKYPETYAPEIPQNLVYCGKNQLLDPLTGTSLNMGQAVLSPTRTYAPLLKKILDNFSSENLHGIIHCSGGGQTKCLKFGENIRYIKNQLFPLPPLFAKIKEDTGRSLKDLLPVYNMGHRMEMMVNQKVANTIIQIATDLGIAAQIIGYCEPSDANHNQLQIYYNNHLELEIL